MAVASAYARSFGAVTVVTPADVNLIQAAVRTLLTTTLAVGDRWTEVATDVYQSPADPVSGAFMKIAFQRISASEIIFTVQDKNGTFAFGTYGINGFNGTPSARIFAGPTHFSMYRTDVTDDLDFMAYIVDPSPEAANASLPVVYCRAMRNNGGGTNNAPIARFRTVPADGYTAYGERLAFPGYSAAYGAGNETLLTAGGSEVVLPAFMSMYPGGTNANNRATGQVPQVVWVDQTHTVGQLITVPIDSGVFAVFEVGNWRCQGFASTGAAKLAYRVG
jgi:hypothetical protein